MRLHKEPARIISGLIALVPLIFAVLTSFGAIFPQDQQEAIAALLYGVAVLFRVGGEVIRSQVSPVHGSTSTSTSTSTPTPLDPQHGAANLSLIVGILVGVVIILAIIVLV